MFSCSSARIFSFTSIVLLLLWQRLVILGADATTSASSNLCIGGHQLSKSNRLEVMAVCRNLSFTAFRNSRLRAYFESSGMQSKVMEVEPGTFMHCWVAKEDKNNVTGGGEKKPNLVLVHGFGANAMWQWHLQIRPLKKHFHLLIPDLLFFGRSTTNSSLRTEVFQAQMIMKLLEQMKVDKISVAGTSYGGFVAFWMAALFPQVVEKVIIANSNICMNPADLQGLNQRAETDEIHNLFLPQNPESIKKLLKLSYCKPPTYIPSFLLNDAIQYFYSDRRAERAELLANVTLGFEDVHPPVLTQDVLLIWGDHDNIFLPETGHRLKEHLGEKAQLVIVKDTGHVVQLEKPNVYTKIVKDFLLAT